MMYFDYDAEADRIFIMLTEYCSAMEEYNYCYDENVVFDIEEQIADAIADAFPAALNSFKEIGEALHKLIDYGDILDPHDFEDDLIRLYDLILRLREKKTWHLTVPNDEPLRSFDLQSLYGPSLNPICRYDEVYDEQALDDSVQRTTEFKEAVHAVLQFLSASKKPVQRSTLMTEIKNCSRNVISQVCEHREVLNYLGSYFYGSNISLEKADIERFKNRISDLLSDYEIHHIDEVYQYLKDSEHVILSRAYVYSSFQLLSLLKYLFRNEYTFSRPFISLKGVRIPTIPERVIRFIGTRKDIAIADIAEFVREKNITVPRWLSLFDAISKHALIRDHSSLVASDMLGLTPTLIKEIEDTIIEELEEVNCKAVRELICLHKLPRISIAWTEWLLYSVIRQNIPSIHTYTTSPQFRHGIPVLSLSEELANEELVEIADRHQKSIRTTVTIDVDDFEEEIDDDILLEFDWEADDEL